jgi:hypothetical protein
MKKLNRTIELNKDKEPAQVKLSASSTLLNIPQGFSNPLMKQVKHLKKRAFLESYYATDGNITMTCKACGISRDLYYYWLSNDDNFKHVIEQQEAYLNDEMRKHLIDRARKDKGTAELIFYLKSRHPEYKPTKDSIAYKDSNVQWVITRGK